MEIPTESWNPGDFINELSIYIKTGHILQSWNYLRIKKNILGRTCLEKCFIESLAAYNAPLQRTHWWRRAPPSTHLSKRFHLWYVTRLLYSKLIFSLCSRASLLKARGVIWATWCSHVSPSVISTSSCCVFMPSLIPKLRLSLPPDELARCGVKLILRRQTLMGWFVERQADMTWRTRAMGSGSESIQKTCVGDGDWHSSCCLGSRTLCNTADTS